LGRYKFSSVRKEQEDNLLCLKNKIESIERIDVIVVFQVFQNEFNNLKLLTKYENRYLTIHRKDIIVFKQAAV